MEPEQRGRASRASSTSSLGREVRCGCQFYKSDSLLPERRALLFRPPSRTMQQPPAVRCSEHEYEPIAPPPLPHPAMAPVVRITDTDVAPVADSDDSIDDRERLRPELILDGDVVLPLDGRIEDSAMEGRELGGAGDTSEELDSPTAQEFQDRLEQRFLDASTPYTESRTDGEVNTSQVDSSVIEELPLQRGVRSLPQRLKTQAGKLRSRLQRIQRPAFTFAQKRQKPDKKKKKTTTTTTTTITTRSTATSSGKSDSRSRKSLEKRPSRIERLRSSISERTGKFSLDRPRFSLPDKSKFHLPERPKFRLPDKSKFHLPDRPKFNIKKPNIRLPEAFARVKKPSAPEGQLSTESTAGSRRNIFDFATYPRIFDKKKRGDYATTSSPKESRTESVESATFPRARTGKPRWTQRLEDARIYDRPEETAAASDGSPSWHQTSLEEPPRLSARTEEEILAAAQAIPWDNTRKQEYYDDEEIQYMDYEQESSERSDRHPAPPRRQHKARREESYEHEEAVEVDPRLYGEQKHVHRDQVEENDWRADQQVTPEEKFRPIPRSRSLDENMRAMKQDGYDGAFMAVDPRRFVPRKAASEERGNKMELEEDEENEPSSMQSDREQQASSGSSCDRRRRGVIEEIDSDEFFLRASGISQDDVHLGEYLTDKIRDALRSEDVNALDDIELPPTPPQRPMRMRSRRKRKEASVESNGVAAPPPARPKRERAAARRSREASIVDEMFRERTRSDSRSDSRHRVVYQTEGDQQEPSQEPLDDIVVVKPARRKRSSSLRSQSQPSIETSALSPPTPDTVAPDASASAAPPVVPVRRKRSHRETTTERRNGDVGAPIICNGDHRKWEAVEIESKKPTIPTRPSRSRSRQSLIERLSGRDVMLTSQEDIRNLSRQDSGAEVAPMPPKRRSRSRATSVAADEDRTSHGAESLPEAGYVEEDIPREEESGSMRDLSNGYAIVDKRPPPRRLPPPRRKRDKFATLPKPVPPKRPQRAYSTLGPSKKKDVDVISETTSSTHLAPAESAPYTEIDGDEHRDLRSGEVLTKMQGRPLPAPPRPPRIKKEHTERPRTPFEFAETTTATQTDPLPDDMVIEEEITQAKLIVTPSRSGSQVLVSMERIPSPSRTSTPPVPPLPVSKFFRSEEEEEEEEREEDIRMEYDTVSLTSPSPIRETDFDSKHKSAPHLQERIAEESQPRSQPRLGLLSDEPLRIGSLEVGDLKVDRLSVSQIEAHKIVASEVDALMITASEMRGGGSTEDSFSPAIIRELMAIRSHLETVTSQAQERQREREAASHKTTDISTTDSEQTSEQQTAELQLAPQKSTQSDNEQQLAAESQTAQQLLVDLQLAQQLLAELQSAQRQSAELQLTQQRAAEKQSAESQLTQQQSAESQLTQQQSTESQPEEQQSAESQLTQQQLAQQLPTELQSAQQLLVDLQLTQQLLAELQSAPQQSEELQLAEQQPAEQPLVEQPVESWETSEIDVNESALTGDGKTEAGEDQKVVKTDVIDVKDKEISHTPSVAQAKEPSSPQTLPIDDSESKDTNKTITHLLSVAQDTQDKSLRILDSEHPLTLSSTLGSHVAESRASYPSSDAPSVQLSESRVSPERMAESLSSSVQTTATSTTTTTTEPDATSTGLHGGVDNVSGSKEQICRESRSSSPGKSRSRSSSPKGIVRQTASPVRSLPPVISVTPDTPDSTVPGRGASMNAQPQRAVISYSSDAKPSVPKTAQPQRAVISHSSDLEQSLRDVQRESSQSPVSSFPLNTTHFIAIPASEIPASFFALSETPTSQHVDSEPGVIDTTQQLLRALRLTGIKAMRHFVRYLTSTITADDTREKVREVELAICALLLLIAGLLIYYFSRTQTVTHLHHWDYFNPPQ